MSKHVRPFLSLVSASLIVAIGTGAAEQARSASYNGSPSKWTTVPKRAKSPRLRQGNTPNPQVPGGTIVQASDSGVHATYAN